MEKPMLLAGAAMADILVENPNYIYSYLTEKKIKKFPIKQKQQQQKTNKQTYIVQWLNTHIPFPSQHTLYSAIELSPGVVQLMHK